MPKLIVELVGAFFLVLTIGLTVTVSNAGAMAPIAIGAALMVMVFAGGHVSGAHYNPAVTLGVWLRGKLPTRDVPGYVFFQLLGAGLAAFVVTQLGNSTATPAAIEKGPAFLAEMLFTFALVWVVLNVATAKGTSGNSFYGLAIGMTVTAGAYAVGPISGGAFNPAVVLGLTILNLADASVVWIHLLGEIAGAVGAAYLYKAVNGKD